MTPHDADEPTEALLGGRYRVGPVIGRGGMATVHRAQDLTLERTVAIKVLRPGADAASSPERARTEMTVLAGLNHPSLVTLYDADIGPGRGNYLVMECIEGPSLAERLSEGPMQPAELARLLSELADALHVVHASGVVHRDIKPSNVLLAPTGSPARPWRAKLADFGVAFLVDSTRHTSPGTVIGTGAYLAPEQVRGEALTPAADVYALGLMTLEALTGQRAYPHATGIGAVLARLTVPPTIPEWMGRRWGGLLSRMTASDPDVRPSAAEVARLAATLPAVAAPTRSAAAASADVPTQALPVPVPARVPVAPATGTADDDETVAALPAARRASSHTASSAAPRRRTRAWIIGGAVAASLALVLVVSIWTLGSAGGAIGPRTPIVSEPTQSAPPADPGVAEVADEPTVDTVDAPTGDTSGDAPADVAPEQTVPVGEVVQNAPAGQTIQDQKKAEQEQRKAEQAAAKAAAEAQRAAEKAAQEAARSAGDGPGATGKGQGKGQGGGPGGAPTAPEATPTTP